MEPNEERARLVAMAEAFRLAQAKLREDRRGFICRTLDGLGHPGAEDAKNLVSRALNGLGTLACWIHRNRGYAGPWSTYLSATRKGNAARIRWIDQLVSDIEKRIAEIDQATATK